MDEKIVTGKVVKAEDRSGGWTTFHVDAGTKYPIRVDTKQEDIISIGRQALDWPAVTVSYVEKDAKNTNPNTGKPYVNRYVNRFERCDAPPSSPTAQKPSANNYWKPKDPKESRLIVRQVAIKSASDLVAQSYPSLESSALSSDAQIEQRVGDTIAIASRFEDWILREDEAQNSLDVAKARYTAANTYQELEAAVRATANDGHPSREVYYQAMEAAMPYAATEDQQKALTALIYSFKTAHKDTAALQQATIEAF